MPDQFLKGLEVIRCAAEDAVKKLDVKGAVITMVKQTGDKPGGLLKISANGSELTEAFTYGEIEDSGEAIDAPSAVKVRLLVSRFVR